MEEEFYTNIFKWCTEHMAEKTNLDLQLAMEIFMEMWKYNIEQTSKLSDNLENFADILRDVNEYYKYLFESKYAKCLRNASAKRKLKERAKEAKKATTPVS